jgi:APA family basic amino acid/polyamine antiporter
MLFYVLTISGLFVLRKKRPDMPRQYKAFGYHVLPAIYIVLAALVALVMLIYQTGDSLRGLVIVLLGIPVYYSLKRKANGKVENGEIEMEAMSEK